MSDLISRQAVLDIVDGWYDDKADIEDLIVRVTYLPSAEKTGHCDDCKHNNLSWEDEPCESCTMGGNNNHFEPSAEKTGWIPVSKKLPEESGEYLVSVIDGLYGKGDYKAVGIAWFAHQKDYAIVRSEWRELGIGEEVTAWMPLPEPYKADNTDREAFIEACKQNMSRHGTSEID